MANKMVAAIYRRHNEESPLGGVDAPQFKIQRYLRELKKLQAKGDQFRLHLKTLLTEQRSLTRRFFATLAQEVIGLHQRLRQDAEQWANDALMPLMQHVVLEQIRRARQMGLADDLRMERDLVRHCFYLRPGQSETLEGIRALAVDKCQAPQWQPARIEDVTPEMVAPFFVSPWPAHAHPLAHLQ